MDCKSVSSRLPERLFLESFVSFRSLGSTGSVRFWGAAEGFGRNEIDGWRGKSILFATGCFSSEERVFRSSARLHDWFL